MHPIAFSLQAALTLTLLLSSLQMPGSPGNSELAPLGRRPVSGKDDAVQKTSAATKTAALKCKSGYTAAKTPIAVGGKLVCLKKTAITSGKKLLTSSSKSCSACHSLGGIAPYTQMIGKLRAHGDTTLKPAHIVSLFQLNRDLMAGASLSIQNSKDISTFLQSLK